LTNNEKSIKLLDEDQVCKASFKMAEVLALTECGFECMNNNEKSVKLSDCRKCADHEKEFYQVLNKLSCAQLIIALFNKEHKQDSRDTKLSQKVRMICKNMTSGNR
jgi:hypothetical protein